MKLNRERNGATFAPNHLMDLHAWEVQGMRGYKKSTVPMPPAANEEVCAITIFGEERRKVEKGGSKWVVLGGGERDRVFFSVLHALHASEVDISV